MVCVGTRKVRLISLSLSLSTTRCQLLCPPVPMSRKPFPPLFLIPLLRSLMGSPMGGRGQHQLMPRRSRIATSSPTASARCVEEEELEMLTKGRGYIPRSPACGTANRGDDTCLHLARTQPRGQKRRSLQASTRYARRRGLCDGECC